MTISALEKIENRIIFQLFWISSYLEMNFSGDSRDSETTISIQEIIENGFIFRFYWISSQLGDEFLGRFYGFRNGDFYPRDNRK